jgi:K+-transporting ATPase A subunit
MECLYESGLSVEYVRVKLQAVVVVIVIVVVIVVVVVVVCTCEYQNNPTINITKPAGQPISGHILKRPCENGSSRNAVAS